MYEKDRNEARPVHVDIMLRNPYSNGNTTAPQLQRGRKAELSVIIIMNTEIRTCKI